MPIKFPKEVSSHLFKYVSKIDIKFNPFDGRTRSAREVFRQVQAERFRKSNPKLAIAHTLLSTPDAPSVKFVFIDGTEKMFDSQMFTAREIIDEIHLITMDMNTKWQLDGKNVDET